MAEFDDIIASAAGEQSDDDFNKESWAAQKQQERNDLFERINALTEIIISDVKDFRKYLDVQARFDRYSVSNALLILDQKPDATRVRDFDSWKADGFSVKRNESAITILARGDEFIRDDGSTGVYYTPKKVFDISQTDAPTPPKKIYSDRALVKAVVDASPVPVRISEGLSPDVNAYYEPSDAVILVRPGMDANEIVEALSREIAMAKCAAQDGSSFERSDFVLDAQAASYMVCKHFGIDAKDNDFSLTLQVLNGCEIVETRRILSEVNDNSRGIIQQMSRQLDPPTKNSKQQEDNAR